MINEFPRRNRLDRNTKSELSIHEAIQEVENLGADERLTTAVNLLGQAKDLVSDYIDEYNHCDGVIHHMCVYFNDITTCTECKIKQFKLK